MGEESKLENYCLQKAQRAGGYCFKVRFIARKGAPDRLLWLPGMRQPIWIEFKAYRTGILAELQKRMQDKLRRMGMTVYVWDTREHVDAFFAMPKGLRGKI